MSSSGKGSACGKWRAATNRLKDASKLLEKAVSKNPMEQQLQEEFEAKARKESTVKAAPGLATLLEMSPASIQESPFSSQGDRVGVRASQLHTGGLDCLRSHLSGDSSMHLQGFDQPRMGARQSIFGGDGGILMPEDLNGKKNVRRGSVLELEPPKPRRQLRLNDLASRITFLKEHPFFVGTSKELRDRLAPQLVRRSSKSHASEVLLQHEEPAGDMDYLFLTAPDVNAKVEVYFDGKPLALLGGSAIFGQEVVFGAAKRFLFTVRVDAGAKSSLWVVPRQVIQSLMQKEMYKADAALLEERTGSTLTQLLRGWLLQPTTRIILRHFENAAHDFKNAAVEATQMEVHPAGATIRKADVPEDRCLCIYRGEARVNVGGQVVARLTQGVKGCWGAWWGMLEVLGVVSESTAEVVAQTDCVVLLLDPAALKALRKPFPNECRIFERVAEEHMKVIAHSAAQFTDIPGLARLNSNVLADLASAGVQRICHPGEQVVTQDTDINAEDLFFIARGRAAVQQKLHDKPAWFAPEMLKTLSAGDMFGELTALGFDERRTTSVVCETMCDIRVIPASALLQALESEDRLAGFFKERAAKHGHVMQDVDEDLAQLDFFETLAPEFLERLQAAMKVKQACKGQILLDQKVEADTMLVIVEGCLSLDYDNLRMMILDAPLLLGDTALIHPGCRNIATVRCHTYTTYLSISVTRLKMLLKEFPEEEEVKFCQLAERNIESLRGMLAESVHKTNISHMVKTKTSRFDGGDTAPEGQKEMTEAPRATVTQGESVLQQFEGAEEAIFKEVLDKYFVGCDPKFCDFLVRGMEKTVYFADQVMLREGDEGDFAIILQRGSAVVEVGGVRVGEVKEGGLIGEAVLLGNAAQRTATVRAVGFVSAFTLDQSVVLAALAEFPEEKDRIAATMSVREQANKVLTGSRPSELQGNDKGVYSRESAQRRTVSHTNVPSPRKSSKHHRKSSKETRKSSKEPADDRRSRGKSFRNVLSGDSKEVSDSIYADSHAGFAHSERSEGGESHGERARSKGDQTIHGERASERDQREMIHSSSISWKEDPDDEDVKASLSGQGSSGWSSKSVCGSWSQRCREARQRAEQLADLRQAQIGTGALSPLVPAAVGYAACPKPRTPWSPLPDKDACAAAAVVPWKLRMQSASKCYKPKVWHEVFG